MSQSILSPLESDMNSDTTQSNNTSPDNGKPCSVQCFSESEAEDSTHPISRSHAETVQQQPHFQTTRLDNRRVVECHPLMSPKIPSSSSSDTCTDAKVQSFTYSPDEALTRLNNNNILASPKISPLRRLARLEIVERETASGLTNSDSEPDLSQYQATVEPTLQTVSLVSNNAGNSGNGYLRSKLSRTESKESAVSGKNSSVDSLSVRSFDELDGLENHRVYMMSHGSSTSLAEECELTKPNVTQSGSIPVLSASEEARSLRSWQKVVLPDGKTREIDMKVIEPYKRVLSHGGYMKEGGQNAIVIFSSCFLPDRTRTDYHYVMDSLFLYVIKTLEQLVTDDYIILYLHGGSCKSNVPSFPWLKRCYQLLDRRLRKSLKNVYMVHPTFWLKSLVWMSRPFISSKFWRKLVYVKSLEELYTLVPTLERQAVPEKVKSYDAIYYSK